MALPRIACILNYAPHYREPIFTLLDRELHCDFYFGANLATRESIPKMDVRVLSGFKRESRVFWARKLIWQCGYPWSRIREYDAFILTGDTRVSHFPFMLACRFMRKPVLLWGHGIVDDSVELGLFSRWLYKSASGWLLYGERGRDLLAAAGLPEDRLHVIYNSLDYDRQRDIRAQLSHTSVYRAKFGNADPVAIFIGRLTPHKKLSLLLIATAELAARGKPMNVVLVGLGEDAPSLRSLASDLGLDARVWFYGACHDERTVGELLLNASVCVSPGEVGLTAMHSFAYGCPVVTHSDARRQMPEYEAITEGRTGALFPYDSETGLADAILRALAIDKDVVTTECLRVLDEKYNAQRQLAIIREALGLS